MRIFRSGVRGGICPGPGGPHGNSGGALLGAGLVIAVENVPKRKLLAKEFGADVVIDYTEQDPVKAILGLMDGQGVDSSIEALGAQATFDACMRATRPGETVSNVGYHGDGEYARMLRKTWGVGMGDKVIKTGLCPGGAERMKRLGSWNLGV